MCSCNRCKEVREKTSNMDGKSEDIAFHPHSCTCWRCGKHRLALEREDARMENMKSIWIYRDVKPRDRDDD